MDIGRIYHIMRLFLITSPSKRADYMRKHKIFYHMGEHCMIMPRKIPLYPQLISFGNNVRVASNVTFVTHDAIHSMLKNKEPGFDFSEFVGCIEIKDNVFIGSGTTILSNVKIGSNTIIGACSLVNKDIENGVYAGVPAKFICPIDDFIEKRRKVVKNTFSKGRPTAETVEQMWLKFSIEKSNKNK